MSVLGLKKADFLVLVEQKKHNLHGFRKWVLGGWFGLPVGSCSLADIQNPKNVFT